MNMEVVFESERINFIKINETLANEFVIMVNDPEVQRFISKKRITYTIDEEKEWINDKIKENAFIFSMIEKDTNEFIGNIEIMEINNGIGELGISITPKKQNNHFGQEAIKRFIDYAFLKLNLDNIELNVFNFNPRAIRCYEKSGFIIDGPGKEEDDIHMIYQK